MRIYDKCRWRYVSRYLIISFFVSGTHYSYVLNRKWVEKENGPSKTVIGDEEVLTDAEEVENAERFEKQYNFRYEEEYVYIVLSELALFFFQSAHRFLCICISLNEA